MYQSSLAENILQKIEDLVFTSEHENKPLEIDPQRAELFELFVTAEGAGYLQDEAEIDLSADAICKELGKRWGLSDALKQSITGNQKLDAKGLARMRLLWSVMRMWMEWDYAWTRWEEFHRERE
jgi:hypothetical protein